MKNKTRIITLFVMIFITSVLTACTNEPTATIRDTVKADNQLTITVFVDDPNAMIESVDIILLNGTEELATATNYNTEGSIEGEWDVTFPMKTSEAGTYEISIEASLSNGDTIELVTESIEWP